MELRLLLTINAAVVLISRVVLALLCHLKKEARDTLSLYDGSKVSKLGWRSVSGKIPSRHTTDGPTRPDQQGPSIDGSAAILGMGIEGKFGDILCVG